MKQITYTTGFCIALVLSALFVHAQIETTIFNNSVSSDKNKVPFFTNRPIVVNEDNTFTFKNSSTDQTNTLYFCNYNFATDSIALVFRAVNLSDSLPTSHIKNNIIYDMYQHSRMERGIRNFYFVVGGYGKSFKKQVHGYMKRLKTNYGDSLFNEAAIVVFAWGTEDKAYKYYNALRASKRGAADFAIFQHMLDEFFSDEEFFKTHPNDLTTAILFSSMGNEMFRQYIKKREEQNIPLVKTYNRILFVGSVAPRREFEIGRTFYNLNQMADSVDVYVNSKDVLLKLSSVAHLKNRMGNKGPKNPENLPGFVNVLDIKNIITLHDMKGLGHDYLLTNSVLQDEILESVNENLKLKDRQRVQVAAKKEK
ncbi:hypothetical protein OU798_17440 [Prolixibacteraceae bacterium Z1-6]|uniref:Uncharacterized protein n=1 Tax=Draconibacterium aestuarii TaxID=2998507 RepID=A0A9X3FBE9_9BACT|nr:hypothetical protein [Prolixibacteraceae bacterium Z1-6]